jgi:hypothetical protein
MARLESEMGQRCEKVLALPAIDKGMDECIDAILADPALQRRGKHLWEVFAADPTIGKSSASLVEKLASSSEIKELVVDLMQKYPDKTPDEIGEMVGARYEKAFNAPGVQKAFQSSFETLIGKLDPKWEKSALGAEALKRMHVYFDDSARTARWSKRLTELNGGQVPSPRRAVDLYLKNAWSDARMEKFLTAVLSNRKVRGETARLLDELLAVEPVVAELRRGTAEVVADPTFRDAAGKVMLLLTKEPSDKAIRPEMHRLLTAPAVVASVNRLVKVILADAKVEKIVVRHFDRIAADPAIRKACDDLFDNW